MKKETAMKRSWAHPFMASQLILAFLLSSCAHFDRPERALAATPAVDLSALFNSISADVKEGTDSSLTCGEGLGAYYRELLSIRGDDIVLEDYGASELAQIVEKSFATRLDIMQKLRALKIKSERDRDCLGSVQDIIRALRYAEDYLVEVLTERGHDYINLEGESPYLLVNPNFRFNSFKDLKAGDIILTRGNAYSSAAIARIGTHDTQFSHLSFIYEDEKGQLHTTEAHIEIGNVVAPLEKHIDQENARSVVFRYKDGKMAARASALIYHKVKKAMDQKKNIEYDFAMDLSDSKKLFCSEVIYEGFKLASNGALDIPRFKTKFSKGMIPFLKKLGIDINHQNFHQFETFAPGDIQFDSDFELVAEWRNPLKLKDNRQKDAVLTMLFKWMEEEGYEFRPAFSMSIKAQVAWLARRVPLVKKKLEEAFPLNMTTDQLKLFLILDEVATPLQEHLQKLSVKKRNPLTPIEMYEGLEQLRRADLKNYRAWLKYKSELQSLQFDPETRDTRRERELRKLIKKHTPLFHEHMRADKV